VTEAEKFLAAVHPPKLDANDTRTYVGYSGSLNKERWMTEKVLPQTLSRVAGRLLSGKKLIRFFLGGNWPYDRVKLY
jgi:hypothetical protein